MTVARSRIVLSLAVALAGACDHRTAAKDPSPMSASLTLTARAESAVVSAGAPIRLQLTLTNHATSPVWINRRMNAGYPDDLLREVFVVVRDDRGAVVTVPDSERVDAHRSPPGRADFVELGAGQSVTSTVDVTMWFPTRKPGRYHVVATYSNDDSGAAHGLHAYTGSISAPPFDLSLTP
jgi:hypothetical protein